MTPGPIARLLIDDHRRLEALLARAFATPGRGDADAYAAFRAGLLRHIGLEEKVLLPAAQRARGGEPLPEAARLRLDHGALAALLVPSPDAAIHHALRTILDPHDALEERADGVYAACDRLLAAGADALVARLRDAPAVPVSAPVDDPRVREATRRALARAGYDADLVPLRA
jgi:hypothetical protein